VGIGLGVGVGVMVGVAEEAGVAVGVDVTVGVGVVVGVTVGVAVGVREGVSTQTISFCTVATLTEPLNPPAAMSRLSPIAPAAGNERATSMLGELVHVSLAGS
jgi:hypothetical protein